METLVLYTYRDRMGSNKGKETCYQPKDHKHKSDHKEPCRGARNCTCRLLILAQLARLVGRCPFRSGAAGLGPLEPAQTCFLLDKRTPCPQPARDGSCSVGDIGVPWAGRARLPGTRSLKLGAPHLHALGSSHLYGSGRHLAGALVAAWLLPQGSDRTSFRHLGISGSLGPNWCPPRCNKGFILVTTPPWFAQWGKDSGRPWVL